MIQKMQEPDGAAEGEVPVLNDSEEILLLVDEAHRSHTSTLHARLMQGLPNAARSASPARPSWSRISSPPTRIFGPFIDTYTLDQSQDTR